MNKPSPHKPIPQTLLSLLMWGLVVIISLNLLFMSQNQGTTLKEISFNDFISLVQKGKISSVTFEGKSKITGSMEVADGQMIPFQSIGDNSNPTYVSLLLDKGLVPNYKEEPKPSVWASLLISFLPLLLVGFFLFWILSRAAKGGGGLSSVGKMKTKNLQESHEKVYFADVAGVDESKEELQEIVEFLKSPQKFTKLGGKLPKGALLIGPPGTGKTMLAKAVACEAGVPFLSISGSEFVEMFVGVGASRVRDLFEQAKQKAPCIIFIDEIDAVGKARGSGAMSGGHDEREQTLNQLLVEMDGFDGRTGIIILAATNRADVLDKALLRPGRFDRRVTVGLPDVIGREKILNVHSKKIKMAEGVNLHSIARGTAGFSGAELANLINEAVLFTARKNRTETNQADLEEARDKILMGPERKSMQFSAEEKKTTAYHEAGHTILAVEMKTDPIHKVTIIPRGMALGVTQTLPEENQLSLSKEKAEKMISMLMGGRIAEEVFFSHYTTGASNDIERATGLARRMVTEWGMSSLGPINYKNENGGTNLYADFSESTRKEVDDEIKKIINQCYAKAKEIIENNKEKLIKLSEALIEKETLDAAEVLELLK